MRRFAKLLRVVSPVHCQRAGEQKNDRIYARDEVRQHNRPEDIWIIYRFGVYDVTEFLKQHPGGSDKLFLAAGLSIEPYWRLYPQHENEEIHKLLESFRIGSIEHHVDDEEEKHEEESILDIITKNPLNAETPSFAYDRFLTPNELFFKRNHFSFPEEVEEICFFGENEKRIKIDDLKKLEKVELTVTLQCSGNRRTHFPPREVDGTLYRVQGLPWRERAISTAKFSGIPLADLLPQVFSRDDLERSSHVSFVGADGDPITGEKYETSLPLSHCCLLVFEMNGEILPKEHGYPCRLLVPGITGCRSVKWLREVRLLKSPSESFWQKTDYRVLPPDCVKPSAEDYSKASAIMEVPVQSAIVEPSPGFRVYEETLTVRGYAYSGGGRKIEKVELSSDGGETWELCDLEQEDKSERVYSWTLFTKTINVKKKKVELICRATDSAGNVQVKNSDWNIRGLLETSWHVVEVNFN